MLPLTTLLPQVLGQARDNGTPVSVVGGVFPSSGTPGQLTVSLISMDR